MNLIENEKLIDFYDRETKNNLIRKYECWSLSLSLFQIESITGFLIFN